MNQPSAARPAPPKRQQFPHFEPIDTRWADNDVYGHINNVAYYAFFDTAVNRMLAEAGLLDIESGEHIALVVHTECRYFAPLAFPQALEAGVAVAQLGSSSVHYDIGVFARGADTAAAAGRFVHVLVDRATRRPQPWPAAWRARLQRLQVPAQNHVGA
jgi:acyl-CoA thioester hydrolase